MGDVDVDALQVVGAGAADCDLVEVMLGLLLFMAKLLLSGRMERNASPWAVLRGLRYRQPGNKSALRACDVKLNEGTLEAKRLGPQRCGAQSAPWKH